MTRKVSTCIAPLGLLIVVLAAGCAAGPAGASIRIVETIPVELDRNDPDVPDAAEVWPELVAGAKHRISLAGFYWSGRPQSQGPGLLEPFVDALAAAGRRGVIVRVLGDAGFYDIYAETLDRLSTSPGVDVRIVDYRARAGGPMHAKYFVVDGETAYLGSQNFDWRALEHIHELGAIVRLPDYARVLESTFASDWEAGNPIARTPHVGPPEVEPAGPFPVAWIADGDTLSVWPALSPRSDLPDTSWWDLPRMLEMIDNARDRVRMTALSYSPVARDGTFWPVLDDALRAAAVRGVTVQVLLSNWTQKSPQIDFLKSLHLVPGIEVRIVTVPEASEGFIPFARVTHAKYLTVDGQWTWLGTSNWEKSYFHHSRNVGFVAHGRSLTADVDRDFETWWSGPYAEPVDPGRVYELPRIGR